MNTIHESNFTVMPMHANYLSPLIFGGASFSELDLCAAKTVRRFLYASKTCKQAVTHKANVTWFKPCYVGDLMYLRGEVVEVGKKSIVVNVNMDREELFAGDPCRVTIASGQFIFVSISQLPPEGLINRPGTLPYAHHGLTLEED
jgi:acyl-CoA hydrolase